MKSFKTICYHDYNSKVEYICNPNGATSIEENKTKIDEIKNKKNEVKKMKM